MTEVVLDASVVLKWFGATEQRGVAEARDLRRRYTDGELEVLVPSLLFLEVLNVTGRRWGWDEGGLLELASTLGDLRFEIAEASPRSVAPWVARGLTAYDAAYVALAQDHQLRLVTDDAAILDAAPDVALPLVARS